MYIVGLALRKNIVYTVLLFIYAINLNAQNNARPYEEIAVNYFAEEIVKLETELKFFIFDGNLETTSSLTNSFCISLNKVDGFENNGDTKINVPSELKKGFLKTLFVSAKRIGKVYVFKQYPKGDDLIVVIYVRSKLKDDFYSILIDKENKNVITYCKKRYYQ
ncbi:hypothetical protein [Flavobacterium mesophilum]|uniref:hypothetical protein n=1 Tax=Flavobacterium mesophilum TaxID=3143495 RepID=UPI0031D64BE6